MILKLFNVTQRSINENDLEEIRQWRNSDYVKKDMLIKEHISEQQQREWYKTINNNSNYYFIIEVNNEAAGVANIKSINRQSNCAEPGVFFNHIKYSNGIIPLNSGIILFEAAFYLLGLSSLYSKVAKSNMPAFKFNENLGFTPIVENNQQNFFQFKLTQTAFEKQQKKIRKALAVLHDSSPDEKIKLTLSQNEFSHLSEFMNQKYFDITVK